MSENVKTIKVNVDVDETPVKSLKAQLREATLEAQKLASAEVVDQAALEAAVLKTAKLKDQIADVNEQIAVFATGSKYEAVSNSLGQIGDAIVNLDFGKAQERALAFSKAAKAINFGDATQSVKQLGSTFVTIGKAILTNPLFLLVAIISGIVIAIYKFLDSLGLIKPMMEIVGAAIDYIVGLFEKLTDFIDLTNNAAKNTAEETAKAYEESAERIRISSESSIQSLDNRIRMAKLEGKDTTELERQKRKELDETAKAQMKADQAKYKSALLNSDLTAEEIKELKEKARQSRLAYQQSLADTKHFEAEIRQTKKDEKKKEKEDDAKDAEQAAKDAEARRKEAEAKRKAYAQARLQAERLIRDLELESMIEGIDKDIALNNEKYKRLIQDTKNNESLIQKEKDAIIKQYEDLRKTNEEKIRKESDEKTKAEAIKAQQEYSDLIFNLTATSLDKEIKTIEQNNATKLEALKKQLSEGKITKEQFDAAEIALEQDKQNKLKALAAGPGGDEMDPLSKAKKEAEDKLAIQKEYFEKGLIDEIEFANRREQIERELNQKIKDIDAETAKQKRNNINNYLGIASQGISAISSLMQTSMDNEIKAAEGNEAKQEQLRKKAFEQQKKMQIAAAFINMAQGIISGLGAPFPMNIALPVIAGVTGLANIAKIKSTTYEGGGGGGSAATPTSPSTPTSMDRMGPSFNFQGTGGTANNVQAGGGQSQSIVIQNEVSISETEITDKQLTVANLTNSAKL